MKSREKQQEGREGEREKDETVELCLKGYWGTRITHNEHTLQQRRALQCQQQQA